MPVSSPLERTRPTQVGPTGTSERTRRERWLMKEVGAGTGVRQGEERPGGRSQARGQDCLSSASTLVLDLTF